MSILLDNGEHRPGRQIAKFWRIQVRYRLARRMILIGLWVMPKGRYKSELIDLLWHPMETAPRDGDQILVRRHNDVMYEFHVVWWTGNEPYPWRSEHTAYPTDRLDEWCRIPGARC